MRQTSNEKNQDEMEKLYFRLGRQAAINPIKIHWIINYSMEFSDRLYSTAGWLGWNALAIDWLILYGEIESKSTRLVETRWLSSLAKSLRCWLDSIMNQSTVRWQDSIWIILTLSSCRSHIETWTIFVLFSVSYFCFLRLFRRRPMNGRKYRRTRHQFDWRWRLGWFLSLR